MLRLNGHDGVPKELQAAEKDLHSCKFSLLFSSPEAIAVAEKKIYTADSVSV